MAQADRQATEVASLYSSVMKSSKTFAYQCDNEEDVNMLFMSGCVEAITGCRIEQLIHSRDLTYASLCHPDDLDVMIERVDAAIADRTPWDVDYRICRQDGTETLVRERGEAIFDEDGSILYLQGLVSDASAESELRAQMLESEGQTRRANDEILDLATQIARSVRTLTMLSINARIEAARAGHSGRSFAVVATEISELAKINAGLAKQIAQKTKAAD